LLPDKYDKDLAEDLEKRATELKPAMDMSAKEYIEEIIREKAYLFLRDEIPYTINVEVNKIIDKKKLILITATIFTSGERYKKIIIGRNGQKIKEIGFNARKELELMSGRKIFLEMMVKADAHWMERVVEV